MEFFLTILNTSPCQSMPLVKWKVVNGPIMEYDVERNGFVPISIIAKHTKIFLISNDMNPLPLVENVNNDIILFLNDSTLYYACVR